MLPNRLLKRCLYVVLPGLLVTGSYLPACCQIVNPVEKIVSADGSAGGQRPVPAMTYDPDSKTGYAAVAAGETIYVHLEMADPAQQKKIVRNGLELWIDVKGKKNKKTGIGFPLSDKERAFIPSGDVQPGEKRDMAKMLEPLLEKKKEMMVTGFVKEVNGMQPLEGHTGLRISLHFKHDTLVYDAQIPYTVFARPLPPNASISIGIVEKGLMPSGFGDGGMPGGGDGPPGGGENGPPGGGGPPDGGGPPEGMPPGGEEMQKALKDDVIWFKVIL